MRLFHRREGVPADVLARAALPSGERPLAWATARDGSWLIGTRRLLALVGADEVTTLPWERVEDAGWDREEDRLRVTAIAEYGEPRPAYTFEMDEPALLLQMLRERVTASIVLQRRVPVRGRLGITVIGRRSPSGGPVSWMHSYDAGLDPDDPEVAVVADLVLAQARAEVGEVPE